MQETIRRRRAFLAAMAELLRRRRAIQAGMQATPVRPEGSIAGLSTDYLRAADTVERLQQNLDKDHSLVRRFTGGIVHQVGPTLADEPRPTMSLGMARLGTRTILFSSCICARWLWLGVPVLASLTGWELSELRDGPLAAPKARQQHRSEQLVAFTGQ